MDAKQDVTTKRVERAGEVDVNAAAVVQAVSTYARINGAGQLVERTKRLDLNELFNRMSAAELDAYAKEGTLPEWFAEGVATPATAPRVPKEPNAG